MRELFTVLATAGILMAGSLICKAEATPTTGIGSLPTLTKSSTPTELLSPWLLRLATAVLRLRLATALLRRLRLLWVATALLSSLAVLVETLPVKKKPRRKSTSAPGFWSSMLTGLLKASSTKLAPNSLYQIVTNPKSELNGRL
jgi:hypothetical protein